jgi:superfamily II DNA or RNA helicase
MKLARDEQRNLHILAEIENLAKAHKRIIVFAATVEHSHLLAAVLRTRGFHATSVTSKSTNVAREIAIQSYKDDSHGVKIICNYGVLTTGFDAPKTSAAVISRPTKSLVLYSQMVGRAIRGPLAGGNRDAEIVTIVDQSLPGFRSIAEAFSHWEDVWE